jgi:phage/plasmid-associated DNA primase
MKSSDAYKSYKEWTEENGYYPLGVKTFKSSLEERGFLSNKKNDGNYFLGLTVKSIFSI